MGILVAGSGPSVLSAPGFVTTGGYYDSAYAPSAAQAVTLGAQVGYELKTPIANGSGWWLHFKLRTVASGNQANMERVGLTVFAAAGNAYQYVYPYSQNSLCSTEPYSSRCAGRICNIFAFNAAGTKSAVTADVTTPGINALVTVDLHGYTNGANAVYDMYIDEALFDSRSLAGTSQGFRAFTITPAVSGTVNVSELIIATTDTRGLRVKTLVPNANGTYTQWAGSYADVDDAGVPDSNLISVTTANQKMSFTKPATSGGSSVVAGTLCITSRASGGTILNLRQGLKIGATELLAAADTITSGMVPNVAILTTADMGEDITGTLLDSAEILLKSEAVT